MASDRAPSARGTAADAHRMPVPLREIGPVLLRHIGGGLLRYPNGSYLTDAATDRTVLGRLAALTETELRWLRAAATSLAARVTEELVHRAATAPRPAPAPDPQRPERVGL